MFRQEALDRLRSPEDLNQLLTIVRRRAWLSVATLGILCVAGVVWSIYGMIPVTVDGFGVLINPGNVKGIQSASGGQLVELHFRVGQAVRRGDVLATLNQEPLQKELRQEQDRLDELRAKNRLAQADDDERVRMERIALQEQRKFVADEIKASENLANKARDRNREFVDEQMKTLEKTRELTVKLNQALREKVATIKSLRDQGLTSDDLVLDAESSFADSELRVANVAVDVLGTDLRKLENEQSQLQHQNRVADLQLKILELSIAEKRLMQELAAKKNERELEEHETERRIERLKFQLERSTRVLSDFDGRLLELTVSVGQVIAEGTRIGTIELDSPGSQLRNVAYFPVKDGKRIKPGDPIHVTPATVQRERYGSILGTVTRVSSFPVTQEAAVNVLGSSEIAAALMQRGGAIEVEAELQADPNAPSGYRWTSQGPPIRFSAGTTTNVRITIERRRPISYVFPILRAWVFGEKDDRQPQF